MVFCYLLEKIHSWSGRSTEYESFQRYRKGEISIETFVGTYVRGWSESIKPGDVSWPLMLKLLEFTHSQSGFWRNAGIRRSLCHYELQRVLPWLLRDNTSELWATAERCFSYQLQKPHFVVNLLGKMLENGTDLLQFVSARETFAKLDPGIVVIHQMLGKQIYPWVVYLFRASVARRATFSGGRLSFFRNDEIFYYESFGCEPFWGCDVTTGTRQLTELALEWLLDTFFLEKGLDDDLTLETVEVEVSQVFNRESSRYSHLRRELKHWRRMFRAITDPYVSRVEMFAFFDRLQIPQEKSILLWNLFQELCPGLYTECKTPRTLEHLSRHCIRRTLYQNWRYPEDVYKIPVDRGTQRYLALSVD